MKPTQEQIEAARERFAKMINELAPGWKYIRLLPLEIEDLQVLLSAIPALSADIEAERAAHAKTLRERDEYGNWLDNANAEGARQAFLRGQATAELDKLRAELQAERAAHAETRRRLDILAQDVGQALVAATLRSGESLTEPREHAIVSAVVGLVCERDELLSRLVAEEKAHAETRRIAETLKGNGRWVLHRPHNTRDTLESWQRATGCSTPEDYANRFLFVVGSHPGPARDAALNVLRASATSDEPRLPSDPEWLRVQADLDAIGSGRSDEHPDAALRRLAAELGSTSTQWVMRRVYVLARAWLMRNDDLCVATSAEPTDEQVEHLSIVFNAAALELQRENPGATNEEKRRAGIRAVLRSLPAPTLPSEDEIRASLPPSLVALFDEGRSRMLIRAVHDLMRKRGFSAPPSDEQLAEEAARFADERVPNETRPTTRADIEEAVRIYRDRDYDPLTTWGAFVQGFITARREGCR